MRCAPAGTLAVRPAAWASQWPGHRGTQSWRRQKWAGLQPIFFAAPVARGRAATNLRMSTLGELLEKTVPALGYELVGFEFAANRMLRVYIDKPKGVDVEDCARVSNQLTRLFEVENIDFARLEVSSPGLDRP